jgi:hypothetical protein
MEVVLAVAERSGLGALDKPHREPPDEMNHGRGEQADAGVVMLFVLPLEEPFTNSATNIKYQFVNQATSTSRTLLPVFTRWTRRKRDSRR